MPTTPESKRESAASAGSSSSSAARAAATPCATGALPEAGASFAASSSSSSAAAAVANAGGRAAGAAIEAAASVVQAGKPASFFDLTPEDIVRLAGQVPPAAVPTVAALPTKENTMTVFKVANNPIPLHCAVNLNLTGNYKSTFITNLFNDYFKELEKSGRLRAK
jgi:hypothetical protein